MITLGIETSCDETAASIVRNGRVLSNVVSSSVPLHEKYGGVIPEIASRFHIEYINKVTKKALFKAGKRFKDLDLIAVTKLPGLPGSLVTGLAFARGLSFSLGIPLIGVNHLDAHLYANFLTARPGRIKFPFIGVVVSGGHTNIAVCKSLEDFEIIGKTRDDAVGEAFDKVAKVLGAGYPGGPKIERLARAFAAPGLKRKEPIKFPRAFLDKGSFDFSLSGIKTAVLLYSRSGRLTGREIARIAWSFQEAVFDVLIERIVRAAGKFRVDTVLLGGGVVSNRILREKLIRVSGRFGYRVFYPPPALCVDNAAMIAGLGERLFRESPALLRG